MVNQPKLDIDRFASASGDCRENGCQNVESIVSPLVSPYIRFDLYRYQKEDIDNMSTVKQGDFDGELLGGTIELS